MRERINKPKVFLSHSSLDKGFIDRLAQDLRRCHVDYWLDTEEIRDGRPWLKVIFEDGIPTCDAVIVYLTENSINSKMVEREMDATFVEQLSESGIHLFPYVARAELRGRLRADIRTLHCREWNEVNYHSMLPTVVAEIWRSYMERVVGAAVLQEKNKRLESELEVKRMQERYETTVFSASEEREFSHIRQKLDRSVELIISLYHKGEGKGKQRHIGEEVYAVNLLSSIIFYVDSGYHSFRKRDIAFTLTERANEETSTDRPDGVTGSAFGEIKENLTLELQTYGLARFVELDNFHHQDHRCEFTDKMYRFKYWLDYNSVATDLSLERREVKSVAASEPAGEDAELSYAAQIDEEVSFQDRRERWLTTEEGVLDADKQILRLHEELERRVKKSNEKMSNIKVEFIRNDDNHCVISGRGHRLSIRWELKHDDSLVDAMLAVEGYENKSLEDEDAELTEQNKKYHSEFTLDLRKGSGPVWLGKSEREDLSSGELAARLLSYLLGSIRSSAVYKS